MKKVKGFTLIEAITAMVLILIITIAAFEFLRHCTNFIVDSELHLVGANIGRREMEDVYWDTEPADDDDGYYTVVVRDSASGEPYRVIEVTVNLDAVEQSAEME